MYSVLAAERDTENPKKQCLQRDRSLFSFLGKLGRWSKGLRTPRTQAYFLFFADSTNLTAKTTAAKFQAARWKKGQRREQSYSPDAWHVYLRPTGRNLVTWLYLNYRETWKYSRFYSERKFSAQLKIPFSGRDGVLKDNEKFLPKQSCLSGFSLQSYKCKGSIHSFIHSFMQLFNLTNIYWAPATVLGTVPRADPHNE